MVIKAWKKQPGLLAYSEAKEGGVEYGEVDYPKSKVLEAIWYFVFIFKVRIFMC